MNMIPIILLSFGIGMYAGAFLAIKFRNKGKDKDIPPV